MSGRSRRSNVRLRARSKDRRWPTSALRLEPMHAQKRHCRGICSDENYFPSIPSFSLRSRMSDTAGFEVLSNLLASAPSCVTNLPSEITASVAEATAPTGGIRSAAPFEAAPMNEKNFLDHFHLFWHSVPF